MLDKLQQLKELALKDLKEITSSQSLEEFQEKYLNKKSGELAVILRDLKNVAEDIRPKVGGIANALKKDLEVLIQEKVSQVGGIVQKVAPELWIDPTISSEKYRLGNLHPMTQILKEIEEAFMAMGFTVLDGPEVESDFYNFEALNIPSWHPSREAQDTFYVDSKDGEKLVLRTQTSSMQIRAIQKYGAPLRVVVPGRVFRNEATDASHDHTFYQFECLMVDEGVSISNLIATLKELVSTIFKKDMNVRLRPGYFPFVEPGFELDMSCSFCDQKGCSVCKHTGWIEMGGSGMVHPNVLKHGGLDPVKYSAFAFGMGMSRLLMLKYGIDEIRYLQSGDLRFLKQF